MALETFDTLVIKHLPHKLSKEEKINFLKECGATDVNVIASKVKKYSLAFAKFADHVQAQRALEHLHQKQVMGSFLVCEYARGKKFTTVLEDPMSESKLEKLQEMGTETLLKRFYDKLNHWAVDGNFKIPIPSHLRYRYPPPTQQTLYNISYLLGSCPKFYTQVLHLMNKMNLPCPIDTQLPASYGPSAHTSTAESQSLQLESESESELSSQDEMQRESVPVLKPKVKKIMKRPRVTKQINVPSTKTKKIKFDDVFEDPKSMNKPSKPKLTPIPIISEAIDESVGFGFLEPIYPSQKPDIEEKGPVDVRNEMEEERLEKTPINHITLDALAANRISEKDRILLPVFNNYAEGVPSSRLYVKNLSKHTTDQDLRFIFSAFLNEAIEEEKSFDIRLMQEGRMKGQAFVTYPSIEMTQKALQETNGYILNDKPMVVQFAKVQAAKLTKNVDETQVTEAKTKNT